MARSRKHLERERQRAVVDGRVLTDEAKIRDAMRKRSVRHKVLAKPSVAALLSQPEAFGEKDAIRYDQRRIRGKIQGAYPVEINAFFDTRGRSLQHIHLLPALGGMEVHETPRYVFLKKDRLEGQDVLVFVREGALGVGKKKIRKPSDVESILVLGKKGDFETRLRRLLRRKKLRQKKSKRRS